MDINPREWHPRHQLDRITVQLDLLESGSTQVTAVGRSSSQRKDLWRHSEVIDADESTLTVGDVAHHFLLCALQDRPRSQAAFLDSLIGQGWQDVPLPF